MQNDSSPPVSATGSIPVTPTLPEQTDPPSNDTFRTRLGQPDLPRALNILAGLALQRKESNLKSALQFAMKELLQAALPAVDNKPRAFVDLEASIEDVLVDGGVSFAETRLQMVFTELDAQEGGHANSANRGIFQIDLALGIASCDVASTLISSGSLRSRSASTRARRARLQTPYYCAYTLVMEVKTHSPWAQYCQAACYLLQCWERCGTRLGLVWHLSRFSRLVVMDDRSILVETNDTALFGKTYDVEELARRDLKAAALYHNDIRLQTPNGTHLNEPAAHVFIDFVDCGIKILRDCRLVRGPSLYELRSRGEQVAADLLQGTNCTSLCLPDPELDLQGHKRQLDFLVRRARPSLRQPASAAPQQLGKPPKSDDPEDERRSSSKRSRPDHISAKSQGNASRVDVGAGGQGDMRQASSSHRAAASAQARNRMPYEAKLDPAEGGGDPRTDVVSSGRESDDQALDDGTGSNDSSESCTDDEWQIKDDRGPLSLTEQFQALKRLDVRFYLVSGEVMTLAIRKLAAADPASDSKTSDSAVKHNDIDIHHALSSHPAT